MAKVSFIVPCRNKAKFVARTVQSVLAQTYFPMEIILSDQGSTDGTLEILEKMAAEYKGPNTVKILKCPYTDFIGMAGLNVHLNWIHEQIDGDIVIMCSADDLNHPDRAKYTVEAFEKHNPSYVGTCVQYVEKDLQWYGELTAYRPDGENFQKEDCFVEPVHCISHMIGSSASSAWSRDLWDKYGPLKGVESQDMLLPIFALLERGLWYVTKPLHAYIRHADENNTGLEGIARTAETEEEKTAYGELINFHVCSNYFAILRRLFNTGQELRKDIYEAIVNKGLEAANMWSNSRDIVIMQRIQPKMMKV